jgi:STE24 endopeptidase
MLSLGFAVVMFLWEAYLDFRQHSRLMAQTSVPKALVELVTRLDEEALKTNKAIGEAPSTSQAAPKISDGKVLETMQREAPKFTAYSLSKLRFGMVKSCVAIVQFVVFVILGYYPYIWDVASRIVANKFGMEPNTSEITVSLVFMGLQFFCDTLLELPWSIFSTFVVEKNFNKTTPRLFLSDLLTSAVLSFLIGGPVLAAIIKLVRWGGEFFYLYVWCFCFVFSLFFLTVFPVSTFLLCRLFLMIFLVGL